jgi:tRNA (guanine37-N1)-methyltransferase
MDLEQELPERPGPSSDPRRIRFDVLTLFPGLFGGFLSESILKRALERGLVEVQTWDLRDWAEGKHRQVDDRPFGGGPGMVLMAPPVVTAVEAVQAMLPDPGRLIALTPRGRRLDQSWVEELAQESRIVLLCGRYEGYDERIFDVLAPEPLSVGDYVLSGGEVAAMVVIDAVMRLVPGVLGDDESARDESFGPDGGLEYPHYTRPRVFRGLAVPEVLLGGDHAAIDRWRRSNRTPLPNESHGCVSSHPIDP